MLRTHYSLPRCLAGLAAGILLSLALAPGAVAQDKTYYSNLLVLLPGEEHAPDTEDGKSGTPLPQAKGVPFNIRVLATDGNWNTETWVHHFIRFTSTDDTADLPGTKAMVSGEVVVSVTLNSIGSFTVTAKDLTYYEHHCGTSSVVTVPGPGDPAVWLRITGLPAVATAGQPLTVTIEAKDGDGSFVSGFGGPVALAQLTSQGRGVMEPDQVELVGGTWTGPVTFYLADPVDAKTNEGTVRLAAASVADPAVAGQSDLFRVGPGAFTRLQIILPGQERLAATDDGLTGSPAPQQTGISMPVEIYATDEYWNRTAANDAVILTSDDPKAATPVVGSLSDGYGSLDLTFGSAGTWTVTVAHNSDPAIAGMTSDGVMVFSSAPDFVIEPIAGPVTAGEPVAVTIRVVDTRGDLLNAYNGPAKLLCETGPGSMTPADIVFDGGIWSGDAVFFGADEASAFSCIDYASPPNIGTSNRFTVQPGAFAGVQVILPGQTPQGGLTPDITGDPRGQEAGQEFAVTIQAVDSWWNRVPDVTERFTLHASDYFADLAVDTLFNEGALTLPATFYAAGEHTIHAAVDADGIAPYTSTAFIVEPGPYARMLLLAPGEDSVPGSEKGKMGDPTDQTVGYSFTVHLLATDNWWNPLTDIDDRVELSITDPLAELPAPYALYEGKAPAEVRITTGGYQLLTAHNMDKAEIPDAVTQVKAINSGFHIEAEINPPDVKAGENFTLSVWVTNDAGAVMQEINGIAHVEVRHAVTGEAGAGELMTTSFQFLQGRRSVLQTYTRAEPIVLVIRDELGNDPGLTNVLTIDPAAASTLEFTSDPPWVGGMKSAIVSAKIADRFGNGIADVPVAFAVTSGGGTLEPVDEATDKGGVARAEYTGTRDPEMGTIQATAPGFTTELAIETAFMAPTSAGGTITNYPNPFHPDAGETTVLYVLDDDAYVTMNIYTLTGTLVNRLHYNSGQEGGRAGENYVLWDGKNGSGEWVASGGYILYVEAQRAGQTLHKMRRRIGVVR